MKRWMLFLISLVLTICISGCGCLSREMNRIGQQSSSPETEPKVSDTKNVDYTNNGKPTYDPKNPFIVPLLSGYPADLLPVHEDLVIINTFFHVDGNRQIFKDGKFENKYLVGTKTKTDTEVIMDFYQDRLDSIEYRNENALRGYVDVYSVLVRTSSFTDDYSLIYIEIDLPDSQLKWDNPYFSDYPDHLVSVPDEMELYHTLYSISDNAGGAYAYNINYDTRMDPEAFVEFYTQRYGDKKEFAVSDETSFRWQDDKYHISVVYSLEQKRVFTSVTDFIYR